MPLDQVGKTCFFPRRLWRLQKRRLNRKTRRKQQCGKNILASNTEGEGTGKIVIELTRKLALEAVALTVRVLIQAIRL